ncbi:unnamed protein product [Spirodela intermedia]|uniref:Uncharacterized protein n=1 Tax=Spirodela intermedia TaxID=51605 RepID=A0A7I8IKS3_SPIIN|nr:unnamed protein product [Spirodela intermedia]CAA6658481.1 unnamed protein product [Spirodela intermedia]
MQMLLLLMLFLVGRVGAWTGEINGRVLCDVCGDSSIGPEDHALAGAEVAVLCITESGEVVNYQAFTDSKGAYTVAETMPEVDRWSSCLVRPIGGPHPDFSYTRPSGYSHTVRPFLFKPSLAPVYCA